MTGRLTPAACARLVRAERAVFVDLREPAAFAAGHPRGAISVRYDPRNLVARLRVALPEGAAVIVLADDDGEAEDGARQLDGPFRVVGRVAADAAGWQDCGIDWGALPVITSEVFAGPARERYHVLDVREPMEWETGHVPRAQLIALGELRERLADVPRDCEIAVICEAGVRSATAASMLRAAGFERVANVGDGTSGYRRSGHPLGHTPQPEEGE